MPHPPYHHPRPEHTAASTETLSGPRVRSPFVVHWDRSTILLVGEIVEIRWILSDIKNNLRIGIIINMNGWNLKVKRGPWREGFIQR
jgi:hypothetical protein